MKSSVWMAETEVGLTTEPALHLYLVQAEPSAHFLAVGQAGALPEAEA